MTPDNELFDRALLTRRRARAAPTLTAHDFLLERAAEDIGGRLEGILRKFPVCLNIGAHHGLLGDTLARAVKPSLLIQSELCLPLVAQCHGARVVADEELLPFAPASLDLVVSALALHWVNDLPGALIQIARALRPDGLFLAAVLGGRTLQELREVLTAADAEISGGAGPRVAPFADVRDYGGLLQRAGFALPVVDSDLIEVTYPSARALMDDIRAMGAANALKARSKRPLLRRTLALAEEIYRSRFGVGERVRASFEIITLTGWSPDESQQRPLAPGSARSRLADALGTAERSAGEKADPKKR
jgi:SAM-dependent methyltransferase